MEAGLLSALFPRKDSVAAFLSHHKEDFAQKNTMRGNLGVAPPRPHTYLLGHKTKLKWFKYKLYNFLQLT